MASRATLMGLVGGVLTLVLGLCAASPPDRPRGRRLVCWKAILKCHGEPECHYAYDQYLYACAAVLRGDRRTCPSHCVSSLVQLNLTRGGPLLEDCDCAADPLCGAAKRAIEPCLPRTSTAGCTEARRQCELDPPCAAAMRDYLFHCRKLFGGERCSDGCRRVIAGMRSVPKAQQLDTCECDGAERNICEYIKVSMETFCAGAGDGLAGSGGGGGGGGGGFSDAEEDSEDDYLDQEDYRYAVESSRASTPRRTVPSVLTTILVLTKFI